MKPIKKWVLGAFFPLFCAYLGHILWGVSNLFTKTALDYASPNVLLALRFTLSALIMTPWFFMKRREIRFRGKNWWPVVALLAAQVLYYLFESWGIFYTNATVSGTVLAVVPIVALLFAMVFLKEYPTRRQTIFCILPVVGVVLMTLAGSSLGVVKPIGIFFLILTCFSSAAYKTANRKASRDFTVFERSYYVLTASALFFAVLALAETDFDLKAIVEPLGHFPFTLSVLMLSIFCSVFANLLVNFAVIRMQVVKISSFGAVTTLVSMFSGVIFLGEPVSVTLLLGAALILVGVHQVTRPATARKIMEKEERKEKE